MYVTIPTPAARILKALLQAGFEAFLVGGCVRDVLLKREPKDWDITTNALPDEIQRLFPDHVYENTFGTVGVKVERFHPATPVTAQHDIIEVTTYRSEEGYTDHRRPDQVTFVTSLKEDLARRDFTVNALSATFANPDTFRLDESQSTHSCELTIFDPFDGVEDLKKRVLRAVGDAGTRFDEDALRMMRAVRFVTELSPKATPGAETHHWQIEAETLRAIKTHSEKLKYVSMERIRDELSRIILSPSPSEGIATLEETGLLKYIIPELEEGIGVGQNLHHTYTVWEHNLRALATCPSPKLSVRLAALLHDVGKPRTKKGDGYRSTFYNHDHVGARMTRIILTRLRYPRDIVDHATLLVDQHLFYYNVGEVTEASVRRLVKKVGLENMHDLMDVRIGDRLGSGVPKAKPYKLRHLEYMIEKVSRDPLSVKMLKINGQDLMRELGLPPGPQIGALLDALLALVLDDPGLNTQEILLERARELLTHDLATLRQLAQEKIEEERGTDDARIKSRHFVQ